MQDYQWVNEYRGLPWQAYTTGPDSYDCLGLVVRVLREHYSYTVPRHLEVVTNDSRAIHRAIMAEIATGNWNKLESPADGAIVLLSVSQKFHHIGVWLDIDGGLMLHSFKGSGVCLSSYSQLVDSGFNRIEFWEKFDLGIIE